MIGFVVLILLYAGWLFVWLSYKGTIYAFPCLVGFGAAQLALATGAGWAGSFVVWIAMALLTFALMRLLFARLQAPTVRMVIALVYVAPSIWMAYGIFDDISAGHVPSELWRQSLCVFGAGFAGLVSFAMLAEAER